MDRKDTKKEQTTTTREKKKEGEGMEGIGVELDDKKLSGKSTLMIVKV